MSSFSDNALARSRTKDPVAQFMSLIGSGQGLPDLVDLGQVFLGTWAELPNVISAAVAADPNGPVLLERSCRGKMESWLVATKGSDGQVSEPCWVDQAPPWSELSLKWVQTSNNNKMILEGAGPLPGGEPWALEGYGFEPVSCAGWLIAPIRLSRKVKFALLLGLADAPDRCPEVRQSLERLLESLAPVIAVWSHALALNARLRLADDENRALLRLNRLQGRFVAMASHEFKAPLTSITAYTDVLGGQVKEADYSHAEEFIGVIRNEADRLLRMVNRILDFTRMGHGSHLLAVKPVVLEPLVQETLQSLSPVITRKNLVVTVDAPAELPRAEVDADLIRQVLMNLLHNAVKYTPIEGRITIKMREEESAVAVSVLDTGPGIPPENIRRVFQEFFRADGGTADEEGTGLGLTIARHIVNLHGGHIEVARRPEGGSDFRFLVPKETGSMAPLADVLGKPIDSEQGARLVDNLLFLLAEMTGSRTVVMLLRNGHGALVPVGAIGLDLDAAKPLPLIENKGWTRFLDQGEAVTDPGSLVRDLGWCPHTSRTPNCRMYAPLGTGESALGCVILGRRRGLETYDQADLIQLSVLSEIVLTALKDLADGSARTTATVKLLLRIRRHGVPTMTPQSLVLAGKLAHRLGLNKTEVKRLQLASVLHDAGMAQVEEEIVFGETELSLDERDEVHRHVEQVVDLLGPLLPDSDHEKIIRHHHERYDGKGYPEGLRAQEIPLGSRLMAVIDTWFSLTSPRPFRSGLSPAEAHAEILAHAGTQFDGGIVAEFSRVLVAEGVLTDRSAATDPIDPVFEESS